jgi:hypothetical protein
MNNNLANLADFEVKLILEFLFGRVIEIGEGINQETLNFRLVCKKFKRVFDKLAYLVMAVPFRSCNRPLSDISSFYIYSSYEITEQDWKDIFGNRLSNLESKLEYLHVDSYSIKYLPKFTCLESISWKVSSGCYELLENIPHNDLMITRYNIKNGSINHLTRLSEIEFMICDSDYKLIGEYLPSTILHMTINIYLESVGVIDLSKFRSLKCLKLVSRFRYIEYLIEELILPPSLYEFYSDVKIKKMNLHECERLKILELKYTHRWNITIPYLPNLCDLRVDSFGGSYSIDTRTLMKIESLTVGVSPQRDTQWSVEFDGLDSYIKTGCATSLIQVCRNLIELAMEFNKPVVRNNNYDIRNLVIDLDINNEYLNCITGVGFGGIVVTIKSHRQIDCIDIDTDKLNVIHEQK